MSWARQLASQTRCSCPPERVSTAVQVGVPVKVGGFNAASVDFSSYLAGRLPYLIGGVLVLSFLILMLVFRSILVPLKAVIMNLLSVGAAYGVIVAIFQWGWGRQLIGVGKAGPVEAWAPMMLLMPALVSTPATSRTCWRNLPSLELAFACGFASPVFRSDMGVDDAPRAPGSDDHAGAAGTPASITATTSPVAQVAGRVTCTPG